MSAFSKASLARDYEKYGLGAKIQNNTEILRDARIYQVILFSLLDEFLASKPEISYTISHCDYGGERRYYFNYNLDFFGTVGNKFFDEFAHFLDTNFSVIPAEYRLSYVAYLGSDDLGGVKISLRHADVLKNYEYNQISGIHKISMPQPLTKYQEFVRLVSSKIHEILVGEHALV